MSGICLGFLKYNSYPAKIFMGDTGSLSIGAILGSISLLTNSIFTLSIFSGIFIIEYSIINIPEKIDKVKMLLVSNDIEPKIAPILRDPVSPINIFAG